MNVIVTINDEDIALTKREASVLYNQLAEALFWEDREANKKEEEVGEPKDAYTLH
jgi:hypothetical protein